MCTFSIVFIPYSAIIMIIIIIIIININVSIGFIFISIIIIENTTQVIEKGWLSGLMIGLYNMTYSCTT